ncbi:hypothetical protein pdam_00007915 [Pocillopora damicornis]|uniref:Uncharacterized protein n=1 Tax=Pocillopora damicornis TaxID=46731 RepID=A0A3M6UFJ9_POCDA|nr:hypothetical protein pdam_00007915 [Pocillopora damicornis]
MFEADIWLVYDVDKCEKGKFCSMLKCTVCVNFEQVINKRCNFSRSCIDGSDVCLLDPEMLMFLDERGFKERLILTFIRGTSMEQQLMMDVDEKLCPNLLPFNGINLRSVVIMGSYPPHTQAAIDTMNATGAIVLFFCPTVLISCHVKNFLHK